MFGILDVLHGAYAFGYGRSNAHQVLELSGLFIFCLGMYVCLSNFVHLCCPGILRNILIGPLLCRNNDWLLDCWHDSRTGFCYYMVTSLFFLVNFGIEARKYKSDPAVFGCIVYSCTVALILRFACEQPRRRAPVDIRDRLRYPIEVLEVYVESRVVQEVKYEYLCEFCKDEGVMVEKKQIETLYQNLPEQLIPCSSENISLPCSDQLSSLRSESTSPCSDPLSSLRSESSSQCSECQKCVCAICYSTMHEMQVIQHKRCVHVFHEACWKQYNKNSCPVCRSS